MDLGNGTGLVIVTPLCQDRDMEISTNYSIKRTYRIFPNLAKTRLDTLISKTDPSQSEQTTRPARERERERESVCVCVCDRPATDPALARNRFGF